jgi:hypothetical protein
MVIAVVVGIAGLVLLALFIVIIVSFATWGNNK